MHLIASRRVEVELLGTSDIHDDVEEQELTSGEGTDHHTTGAEADRAQLDETDLLRNIHKTGGDGTGSTSASLVHLGQQSVSGMRDDGSSHTGNHTRTQSHRQLGGSSELSSGLAQGTGELLGGFTLHGKLGHSVGHLLEQDGAEARVESLNDPFLLHQAGSTISQTLGKGRVGHKTDTSSLEGAQEHVSDGLSHGGGGQVDHGTVVPGSLLAKMLGKVDLEELHTSKFEPTLDKVSNNGGSKTSE
mmetsp:Transcript_25795/g.43496  ORF Transcript_25795/g.43496 Transcript_25795/m.43496 type:complete len:246 (-) Transcript_25795:353-1090(-)